MIWVHEVVVPLPPENFRAAFGKSIAPPKFCVPPPSSEKAVPTGMRRSPYITMPCVVPEVGAVRVTLALLPIVAEPQLLPEPVKKRETPEPVLVELPATDRLAPLKD